MGNEKRKDGQTGFVFIHGAGLNSRIWDQVTAGMNRPCLRVDFPYPEGASVAGEARRGLVLRDYVDYAAKQIEAWEAQTFIIVAHSIGGVLALRLAHTFADRLAGIAAVGAVIPGNGGSFLSTMPLVKRTVMGVLLRAFGTKPPDSAIRRGLCGDLTDEQAVNVVRSFVPESIRLYADRVKTLVPNVPKLYVKLEHDRELPQSRQDQMIASFAPQKVQTLETGHLPMLVKPKELQLMLEHFAARIETAAR
ncbi:alpha/beta hydrolase [Paenibacillus piri]|uniref:Alpha/beta hydrolase n=2 Tax=Paenibacillus piri TaxID=2547395 RepID=A0A4R5KJB3_9BACL|nr:alpha/beta hydrolase [Paenibacillus piri]